MNAPWIVISIAIVTGLLAALNALAGSITDPTVLSIWALAGSILTSVLGWLKRAKPEDPGNPTPPGSSSPPAEGPPS